MYDNVSEKPYKLKKKIAFLEAGFKLFCSRSIEEVKLQDVADASGYGIATLYRYFDHKATLLLEIAAWKWSAFFEENRKRRPTQDFSDLTAAEMLDFYLDSFIEVYRRDKDLLRFNQFLNIYLHSDEAGTDMKKLYQRLMKPVVEVFHEMYEKAKKDRTVRTDVSEEEMLSVTIHLMLAVITRYAIGLAYEPKGFVPEKELEIQKEMLFLKYTS